MTVSIPASNINYNTVLDLILRLFRNINSLNELDPLDLKSFSI